MTHFSGKQLILNEVNNSCTKTQGILTMLLLSKFDHMHLLDGYRYIQELADEKQILVSNGEIFRA